MKTCENLEMALGPVDSLSPYALWRRRFIENHGVTTHFAEHLADDPEERAWCAFVGDWDSIAARCVVMDEQGEITYGDTEREALEALARREGAMTLEEERMRDLREGGN